MFYLTRKIQQYIKAHLSTSFTAILAVIVLLFFVGFQTYLRYGYLNYLEDTAAETENAVLAALTKTVNATMTDNLNFGSELAVSDVLYKAAAATDSKGASDLTLYKLLTGYEYPQNVVSVAVVGPEGLIGQYDRFRSTYYGSMWNGSNVSDIESLRESVIQQCNKYTENVFPRYVMSTEPELHSVHTAKDIRVFHVGYPVLGGGTGISKVKYVLVLTFNMELFSEFLDTVETSKVQYAEGYIADAKGIVLYQRGHQNIGSSTESLRKNPYNKICNEALEYFGWTLNIRIDEKVLREHIDRIYGNAFWILLLILASFALLISFMMNRALRPVKKISRAIKTVKEEKYRKKIPIEGSHEIWQLADEYNRMTDDLTEKEAEIEKVHATAIASLKAQYQAERGPGISD